MQDQQWFDIPRHQTETRSQRQDQRLQNQCSMGQTSATNNSAATLAAITVPAFARRSASVRPQERNTNASAAAAVAISLNGAPRTTQHRPTDQQTSRQTDQRDTHLATLMVLDAAPQYSESACSVVSQPRPATLEALKGSPCRAAHGQCPVSQGQDPKLETTPTGQRPPLVSRRFETKTQTENAGAFSNCVPSRLTPCLVLSRVCVSLRSIMLSWIEVNPRQRRFDKKATG